MWGSKKPKVPEKSGFMGDTSPEQDQVLAQMKEWIIACQIADLEIWDDYDLLRFCRARKFVLADVQVMFENFINWRKEENIDTIIEDFEFPERHQVQQMYQHGYHGTDKLGRPIYIERIGLLDVPALFKITTEERMIRHFIQEYEILMKLRYPACSATAGKKI